MLSFKTIAATIGVPGSACFVVPYLILWALHIPLAPPAGLGQVLACLVIALGAFMVVWVSTAFVRKGHGTPIPVDPPKRLVIQGLYRYVRNPMYVGAVLIVLGEALYFWSAWLLVYATVLWAVLHTALVVFEEQQLKDRFGGEYEQYLKAVPRWIPRIPARNFPPGQS